MSSSDLLTASGTPRSCAADPPPLHPPAAPPCPNPATTPRQSPPAIMMRSSISETESATNRESITMSCYRLSRELRGDLLAAFRESIEDGGREDLALVAGLGGVAAVPGRGEEGGRDGARVPAQVRRATMPGDSRRASSDRSLLVGAKPRGKRQEPERGPTRLGGRGSLRTPRARAPSPTSSSSAAWPPPPDRPQRTGTGKVGGVCATHSSSRLGIGSREFCVPGTCRVTPLWAVCPTVEPGTTSIG